MKKLKLLLILFSLSFLAGCIDIEELNRLKEWNESAEEEFQPGEKTFDINIKFESARNRETWAESHSIKPDKVNCGQWTINL